MTDAKRLRVSLSNRLELILGLALIAVSLVVPRLVNVVNFPIMDRMFSALQKLERTDLMIAALLLVMMNSVRGLPYYLGAFFVGESVEFCWRGKKTWLINGALIIAILRLNYWWIQLTSGIHLDFGLPTVLIFLFEGVLCNLRYRYISLSKKAMLVSFALIAFEFLDIMPAVAWLPVGRGEVSCDIRLSAQVLEAQTLLNLTGMIGMLLFLLVSAIIFLELHAENGLREINALKEKNHEMQLRVQLGEMRNRTNREVQYLVHDLKSPLTSMETLAGLLKMRSQAEGRDTDAAYLERIEGAIEQLSRMISEILYEDRRSPITTDEILKLVLAQISISDCARFVHSQNRAPGALICANRLIFSRAITNLMQNSAKAVAGRAHPRIDLEVEGDAQTLCFSVRDNGRGISREMQKRIWQRGVSDETSSGLGLAFVKAVVDGMDGSIALESEVNRGTRIRISVPREAQL